MNKILSKGYVLFIFISIISILILSARDTYQVNQVEQTLEGYESLNQSCVLKVENYKNNENYKNLNFIQIDKNISVTHEVRNIFCLNKVIGFLTADKEVILYVGKSQKFTDFIYKYFFLILVLINLYLKPKNWLTAFITTSLFVILFQGFLGIEENWYTLTTKLIILFATFSSKKITNYKINKLRIEKISFRQDLNVLRAIAVTSVLFYHAGSTFFKGGWLGVDLFFVISGYLISNSILSKIKINEFKFKEFFLKRVKRIFPAYYFMLLFSIPFSYLLLSPKSMVEFLNNLKYSLVFISNIYLSNIDLYISEPSKYNPLLHTWSLSVEEQFYIFFPILIFYYIKNKNANFITLFNIFLFSLTINLFLINNQNTFYYFQFRLWEFFVGILLMIHLNQKSIKVKSNLEIPALFLLLLPIFLISDRYILDLFPKIISLAGIGLLIINGDKNYILKKISTVKIVSFIGLSSYSIYLYHQPVYAFTRNYLRQSFTTIDFKIHILLIASILTISGLSYVYIEKPYQKNITKFKYGSLGLIFIVVSAFFIIGLNQNGFENRYKDIPKKVIDYSIYTTLYPGDGSIEDWDLYTCENYIIPNYGIINNNENLGPCQYIKDDSEANLILLGDSHANTLSVEMIRNGDIISDKFNFIPINGTVGRCILSAQNDLVGDRYDCSGLFFNDFLNKIDIKDVIIIIGRFPLWLGDVGINQVQCYKDCFPEEILKERITSLAMASKKLIIIYPVPTHPFNITSSYFYGQYEWGDSIYSNYKEWKNINKKSVEFLDSIQLSNIERVYPENIFCDSYIKDQCVAAINNELFYTDDNHLTLEGNNLVIQKLLKFINY